MRFSFGWAGALGSVWIAAGPGLLSGCGGSKSVAGADGSADSGAGGGASVTGADGDSGAGGDASVAGADGSADSGAGGGASGLDAEVDAPPCGAPGQPCCDGGCSFSGPVPLTCALSAGDTASGGGTCQRCGGDGEPCCSSSCFALACDQPAGSVSMCTSTCGNDGGLCCRGGGCALNLRCTTQDETGTCLACGGLNQRCCRPGGCVQSTCGLLDVCIPTDSTCGGLGDWCCHSFDDGGDHFNCSGTGTACDSQAHCSLCGGPGQPCCFASSSCSAGLACNRLPALPENPYLPRTVCTDSCGGEGMACCGGGACRIGDVKLTCTAADATGTCLRCGDIGERCCSFNCNAGGTCDASGVCQPCGQSGQRCCQFFPKCGDGNGSLTCMYAGPGVGVCMP